MSARLRSTMNVAVGALALGTLGLGGIWSWDRARRWEQPVWREHAFVHLRGEPDAGADGARWLVAVNPRCAHCLMTLRRLHAAWSRRGGRPELAVLIVDTSRRPGAAALSAIPVSHVWWDASGIWRRRWGHRLYGELIQFDAAGRFAGTVRADDAMHGRWSPPVPPHRERFAPATIR